MKEIDRLKNGLKNMEGLSNLIAIAEKKIIQENENNLNKNYLIDNVKELGAAKNFNDEMVKRMKKIIDIEDSVLLGVSETLAHSLDMLFRYIFFIAYLLMLVIFIAL